MNTFFETVMKYTRGVLAYIITLATFGFLYALLYKTIPQQNEAILNIAAGFVLSQIGNIANYYFGTSKDKSDVDQSQIFPKNPPNP